MWVQGGVRERKYRQKSLSSKALSEHSLDWACERQSMGTGKECLSVKRPSKIDNRDGTRPGGIQCSGAQVDDDDRLDTRVKGSYIKAPSAEHDRA